MIGFWRQLCYLLWKTILTKWRQKFWLSVELLLPLVLFVLLALIRLNNFTEESPTCHYDAKSLPSAGLLPFINTMATSMMNRCRPIPSTGDDILLNNGSSTAGTSLLVDILHRFSVQLKAIGEDPAAFDEFLVLISEAISSVAELNLMKPEPLTKSLNMSKEDLAAFFSTFNMTTNASTSLAAASVKPQLLFSMIDYTYNISDCIRTNMWMVSQCTLHLSILCNRQEFEKAFTLEPGHSMPPTDFRSLCNISPSLRTLTLIPAITKKVKKISYLVKLLQLMQKLQDRQKWVKDQPIVYLLSILNGDEMDLKTAVMGDDNPANLMADTGGKKHGIADTPTNRRLRELYSFLNSVRVEQKAKQKNRTCGPLTFVESSCSMLNRPIMGGMAKALLKGYILVAPDSVITRRLVAGLERPFKMFEILLRTLPHYANASIALQERLNSSQLAANVQVFLKLAETNSVVKRMLPAEMMTFKPLLERVFRAPSDPQSPSALLNRLAALLPPDVEDCFLTDRFRFVASEAEMEDTAICLQEESLYFSGLVFNNSDKNELAPYVSYKIRHNAKMVDDNDLWLQLPWNMEKRDRPLVDLKYYTFGFSFLQEMIDRTLITEMTGETPDLGAYVQQYPTPCFIKDSFHIQNFLHLCIILSYIVPSALLVKNIVLEKEQKLKEQMRIMGLGDSVHFISWALVAYTLNLVTVAGISVLVKFGMVLQHADIYLVAVWLSLYAFSCIGLSLFLSTWFSNANKATGMSTVIVFIFMFPAIYTPHARSRAFTLCTLLLPQSALIYSGWLIGQVNNNGGVNWQNFFELADTHLEIALWECFAAMLVDAVIFFVLAWYTSAIFPGTFGVAQPWYFPVTKSYWCPSSACKKDAAETMATFDGPNSDEDSDRFETSIASSLNRTVSIEKLAKVYDDGTVALDGLKLQLYEDQITALLGHNGAGKSTVMSILCGLYKPSSGTATIYGRDLRHDLGSVRHVLGFCPQQNVLFPLLTVHEQLRFFAALKGTPYRELYAEANEILESINLTEKAGSLVGTLSGGQKRRLSIGIALIGGSKFVILDEPTAGVDVNNRKDIWTLLHECKKGRTILLSTHHMDEADVLSDRVAVLSEGHLISCGSPVFLKRKLGKHMQLTACKTDKADTYEEIIDQIEKMSPLAGNIKLRDQTDTEIVFNIPVAVDSQDLEIFFTWFEGNIAGLKFEDYGITAPSLQEIFISLTPKSEYKVTKKKRWYQCCSRKKEDTGEKKKREADSSHSQSETSTSRRAYSFDLPEPLTGFWRIWIHIWALLSVKQRYMARNGRLIFFQIMLPLTLILSSETYAYFSLETLEETIYAGPTLPLLSKLGGNQPDSFISLMSDQQPPTRLTSSVLKSLIGEPGLGGMCTENAPKWFVHKSYDLSCWKKPKGAWNTSLPRDEELPRCECKSSMWNCTASHFPFWKRPHVVLRTSDRVWNMAGVNLSQLALTTYKAWNYSTQSVKFFGGFSLAHGNVRAFSAAEVQKTRGGWQWLADALDRNNVTAAPVPTSQFTRGLTFYQVMDGILSRLDSQDNAKVWFNNKFYPSLPIYQNALSNALLRSYVDGKDRTKYGILTVTQPMNQTAGDALDELNTSRVVMFRIILIMLALCTVSAGFSTFLVEERTSGSYHMLLVSGLSKRTYWLTTYAFDMAIYLLSVVLLLSVYLAFGVKEFCHSWETLFSFLLVFSMYGYCAVLWAYIIQRHFTVSSLAFVLTSVLTFFAGAVSSLTIMLLESMVDIGPTMELIHKICAIVFLFLPQYNVGLAIFRGSVSYLIRFRGQMFLKENHRLDLVDSVPVPHDLQWDLMGIHVVFLAGHIVVAAIALIFLEHGTFSFCQKFEARTANKEREAEEITVDADVAEEEERVEDIDERADCPPLVVKDLIKRYGGAGLVVKGVTFAVEAGECFGLLGLNGAGKTTCFNILTGNIYASGGTVVISGKTVERGGTEAFSQVGYCPQFDALNVHLTTRENLVLYARIRSIPAKEIAGLAEQLLRALHLRPYATTLTASLSGGNKRKLSVAIALISQPSLILLDEPSAGMDPGSQQFLWRVIDKLRQDGKAVVITSHSMEECEALCTRIAIMDRGHIRCLGSKQYLKNRFGEGYSLTLKLASSEGYEQQLDRMLELVAEVLPTAGLEAAHCLTLLYKIKKGDISIGSILKAVNKIKQKIKLEDYSLSQATLSDVFNQLSKEDENNDSE